MYDQEVQSCAWFVVEASNVYRAVVVEVDIEGGLCCGWLAVDLLFVSR